MDKFEKFSNYNNKSSYQQIRFGHDIGILETELNEIAGLKKASEWLKARAEKKALNAQGAAYEKERKVNEKQKAEKEALEAMKEILAKDLEE